MIIVSDTSPLRYLILIDSVDILTQLFDAVLVPPAVAEELRRPRTPDRVRAWMATPPKWLSIEAPTGDDNTLDVDWGERQAILLAQEKSAPLLIDDSKGKLAANARKVQTIGTLGVLFAAAERNLLDFPQAIQRLTQTTNFRTPLALVQELLERDAARREQNNR